jgi:hypothetical protein
VNGIEKNWQRAPFGSFEKSEDSQNDYFFAAENIEEHQLFIECSQLQLNQDSKTVKKSAN